VLLISAVVLNLGSLWTLVSTRGSDGARPNRNGAYDPPQMGYGTSWESPARWLAVFGDTRRGMTEQMLGVGRLRRWGCRAPLVDLQPARWLAVFGDARRGMTEQMLGVGRLRRWGCNRPPIDLVELICTTSGIDGLVANRHAGKFRCAAASHFNLYTFQNFNLGIPCRPGCSFFSACTGSGAKISTYQRPRFQALFSGSSVIT